MISNGHIQIRKLERNDVDRMEEWGEHSEINMLHYNFPSFTKSEKDIWYKIKAKKLLKRCYAVINISDNSLLGYISLRNYNFISRSAELGIVMDPSNVNKGYGTEALSIFIEYMLDRPMVNVLKLHVALYNERAQKCYKKVGFRTRYKVFREFEDQSMGLLIKEKLLMEDNRFSLIKNKLFTEYYLMEIEAKDISTRFLESC